MKEWQSKGCGSLFVGLFWLSLFLCAKEQADVMFVIPPVPQVPTFKKEPIPPYKGPLADVLPEQAFNALTPLLALGNISNSIKLMKDLSSNQIAAILNEIIKRKAVSRNNFLYLLFGTLAIYFKTDVPAQERLLDIVVQNKDLLEGPPLLLVAAQHGYAKIVPYIVAWSHDYQKRTKKPAPDILKNLTYDALKQAITDNDVKNMKALLANGLLISPKQASRFLWQAAEVKNSEPDFVLLLKNKKADLEYAKDGHTLLMKAVLVGNLPLVKALVKAGAKIDAMIKTDVGTALQLATENKRIAIEEYLREQGAQ